MNHEEKAVSKRNKGYNCAQAVLCSYAEEIGLKEEDIFKLSEGLGTGLGCTKGACGALNAACMIASMYTSTGNLEHPDSKAKTYPVTRNITKAFEETAGAVICQEIKGMRTGEVLYECEDCVRLSCRLIDEFVFHNK